MHEAELVIRDALPGDLLRTAEIFYKADTTIWGREIPVDSEKTLPRYRGKMIREFNHVAGLRTHGDPLAAFRVASLGDLIVGYTAMFTMPGQEPDQKENYGQLDNIYVDPDYWHRGIGRALVNDALEILKKGGATKAVLLSEKHNTAAHAFYGSTGWKNSGAILPRVHWRLADGIVFEHELKK